MDYTSHACSSNYSGNAVSGHRVASKRSTLFVWILALACCPTSSHAVSQLRGADSQSYVPAHLPWPSLLQDVRGEQNPIDDTLDKIDDVGKPVDDVIKKGEKEMEKHLGKPLMSRINTMRAELCWTRPDLWSHKECLEFLGIVCEQGSTGEGICTKFKDGLPNKCKKDKESGVRKLTCDIAKRLKIAKEEDEEDEQEEEEEEKEEEEKQTPQPEEVAQEAPVENPSDQEGQEQGGASSEDTGNQPDQAAEQGSAAGGEGNTGELEDENDDWDGDGVKNSEDKFPRDPTEWSDIDSDGIGDNKDDDRDGDGVVNVEDPYPNDPTRSGREDSDGDGVPDRDDVFPNDKTEWSDLDKDGIGDNTDDDRDGDGKVNKEDSHPNDASRWDEWDTDGDGVFDKEDAFPNDASEWKDTDGDGVGDNADMYPNDPNCTADPCQKEVEASASETTEEPSKPGKFSKEKRKLPEQGYDEHSPEEHVEHSNQYTWTGDWREEWPANSESERDSIVRICQEHPNNVWCKDYKRHYGDF